MFPVAKGGPPVTQVSVNAFPVPRQVCFSSWCCCGEELTYCQWRLLKAHIRKQTFHVFLQPYSGDISKEDASRMPETSVPSGLVLPQHNSQDIDSTRMAYAHNGMIPSYEENEIPSFRVTQVRQATLRFVLASSGWGRNRVRGVEGAAGA